MPTLTVPTITELNEALAQHPLCQREPNEVQYFEVGGAGILLTTNLGRKGNGGFFTAPYQPLAKRPKITAFVSITTLRWGCPLMLDGAEVVGRLSLTGEEALRAKLQRVSPWGERFHLMACINARLDITLQIHT